MEIDIKSYKDLEDSFLIISEKVGEFPKDPHISLEIGHIPSNSKMIHLIMHCIPEKGNSYNTIHLGAFFDKNELIKLLTKTGD